MKKKEVYFVRGIETMSYLLFLGMAAIGGWMGHKFRLPMGALLGAMISVGIWKILFNHSFEVNDTIIFIAQVLLGSMIGLSFTRFNVREFKKTFIGLVMISLAVLGIIFGLGFLLSHIANLSPKIAMIASAPGAIAEMATLANELKLDPLIIVSLHITRVVIMVSLLSIFIKFFGKKLGRKT